MKLLDDPKLTVERAALDDMVEYESGELIVHDEHAAIVRKDDWHKCAFDSAKSCKEYIDRLGLKGDVCAMNLPIDAPEDVGRSSGAYKTFAYLKPMPPARNTVTIKRLAPTLAQFVFDSYDNYMAHYDEKHVEMLMREKGIFGAIVDGALAGFIGMHEDGNMGLLSVFEKFRRRGIGEELEKFLISYIMTFGRVPLCDVAVDNKPSLSLQNKLGLTATDKYTFWFYI